jgi:hypothetical protein
MPKFVVKLNDMKTNKDYYILWSTIIDGATRQFKDFEEAKKYLKDTLIPIEYIKGVRALESQGVSNPYYTISNILETNDEGCDTVEELIEKYVELS